MPAWVKSLLFIVLLFIVANLAYIDIKLFFSKVDNHTSQPTISADDMKRK